VLGFLAWRYLLKDRCCVKRQEVDIETMINKSSLPTEDNALLMEGGQSEYGLL
jgi:hypothetical protein